MMDKIKQAIRKKVASPVQIELLRQGAFLTIGDGIEKTWAVTDDELLILADKINKLRPRLESRRAERISK